jgi:hypothetical protein
VTASTARPIDRILPRLRGVRQTKNGWSARCPAHADEHPSLGVAVGDDGRVLVKCQAGCTAKQIVAALDLAMRDLFPGPVANGRAKCNPKLGRIVATYPYTDAAGGTLYEVVRYDPKAFRQRKPDGQGGWTWTLNGTPRVPYRLPELLTAPADHWVFVCEGEKDCDALTEFGLLATTNAQGAGKWDTLDAATVRRAFTSRRVVLLPDNDVAGRRHAQNVARHLSGIASVVRVVDLPGVPAKGDVSDWLAAGGTCERLLELVAAAPAWNPNGPRAADDAHDADDGSAQTNCCDSGPDGPKRKSASTRIVELATDAGAELFHTADGTAYVTYHVNGHREHWAVRSTGCRLWLGRLYYAAEGKTAGAQAVQDALAVLEGKALFEGATHPAFVRVAESDGSVYLDLADATWRAVRVNASGWSIDPCPQVRFVRRRGMLSLPEPARGGSLDALRQFVNLRHASGWRLLIGWIQQALRGAGPYPVLVLRGQQGSAKSTHAKLLRSLIDPNQAMLRSTPRDERDLAIAAGNGWFIVLDNLSQLSEWTSDALCRLSTGGGFATRQLFTDQDELILDYTRPCIITSIDDVVTRGDLSDRQVQMDLLPIADDCRRPERELFAAFEKARPGILGALLESVAAGLRELPAVRLSSLPRMADFAIWGEACSRGMGEPDGAFLVAYATNRADANVAVLESSVVVPPLHKLLDQQPDGFQGTSSELLKLLTAIADDHVTKGREWPGRANVLSNRLRRLAPNLRLAGIVVDFDLPPTTRGGPRRLRISRQVVVEQKGKPPSASCASSEVPRNAEDHAHDADDGAPHADDSPYAKPARKYRPDDDAHDADDADDALRPHSKSGDVF